VVYWLVCVLVKLLGERNYELAAEGWDFRDDASPDQVKRRDGSPEPISEWASQVASKGSWAQVQPPRGFRRRYAVWPMRFIPSTPYSANTRRTGGWSCSHS
jgi:hypothetical protein